MNDIKEELENLELYADRRIDATLALALHGVAPYHKYTGLMIVERISIGYDFRALSGRYYLTISGESWEIVEANVTTDDPFFKCKPYIKTEMLIGSGELEARIYPHSFVDQR